MVTFIVSCYFLFQCGGNTNRRMIAAIIPVIYNLTSTDLGLVAALSFRSVSNLFKLSVNSRQAIKKKYGSTKMKKRVK